MKHSLRENSKQSINCAFEDWRSCLAYTCSMPPSVQNSQINIPADVIDLGLGAPPFSLLPLDLIARSAQVRFA